MRKLCIFFLFIPFLIIAQQTPESILAKAVSYHDADGKWSTLSSTLIFNETRPDGTEGSTILSIDNAKGYMKINRNEEEIYEVTENLAEVLKGDKDMDRAIVLRNYFLYLWGLPMKLYDESTPTITRVDSEKIEDIICDVLRVPYEEDVWYFYFDRQSGRMLQYKFYKDEADGKGELIKLVDELSVQGIKIPQKRSWYTLPEMKYLGTDILVRSE